MTEDDVRDFTKAQQIHVDLFLQFGEEAKSAATYMASGNVPLIDVVQKGVAQIKDEKDADGLQRMLQGDFTIRVFDQAYARDTPVGEVAIMDEVHNKIPYVAIMPVEAQSGGYQI